MAPAKKAAKKAARKTTKKAAAKKNTARKTTGKRATAARGGNLVVTSQVREAIRSQNVRMSSDFTDALNDEVRALVGRAVQRARDNNRGTVRPSDL